MIHSNGIANPVCIPIKVDDLGDGTTAINIDVGGDGGSEDIHDDISEDPDLHKKNTSTEQLTPEEKQKPIVFATPKRKINSVIKTFKKHETVTDRQVKQIRHTWIFPIFSGIAMLLLNCLGFRYEQFAYTIGVRFFVGVVMLFLIPVTYQGLKDVNFVAQVIAYSVMCLIFNLCLFAFEAFGMHMDNKYYGLCDFDNGVATCKPYTNSQNWAFPALIDKPPSREGDLTARLVLEVLGMLAAFWGITGSIIFIKYYCDILKQRKTKQRKVKEMSNGDCLTKY